MLAGGLNWRAAALLVLLAALGGGRPWAAAEASVRRRRQPGPRGRHLASASVRGVPEHISDGDTLTVAGTRVRLFGMDAPELKQSCLDATGASYACGEVARDALIDKIGGSEVECEERDRDRYGRLVAVCYVEAEDGTRLDLNGWLVEEGLAVAYTRFSDAYVAAEADARQARRGLWAGEFEVPEDFRRRGREGGDTAGGAPAPADDGPDEPPVGGPAPAGVCLIKGNISRSGEKIYHVPGSPDYDRVIIDEGAGERWFCDAAEAEAAGWRAPR